MKGKWLVLSVLAIGVALLGIVAFSMTAPMVYAQGPVGTPAPGGLGWGRGPMMGGMGGMGGFGGSDNSLIAVAAKTIGIDLAVLQKALNDGQTIADVAKSKGVALDKIVDAFVAPRLEWMQTAVKEGRLSQAQFDAMVAAMKANVNAHLTSKFTPGAYGHGGMMGAGFMDANQDGVCDYHQNSQPNGPRGRWSR